jgi:hypothetical protein
MRAPRQQTAFARRAAKRYLQGMKSAAAKFPSTGMKLGLVIAVLASVTGVAFAAWVESGAAILMAMAETGLSWCF